MNYFCDPFSASGERKSARFVLILQDAEVAKLVDALL